METSSKVKAAEIEAALRQIVKEWKGNGFSIESPVNTPNGRPAGNSRYAAEKALDALSL